jgi:hypothetical protein
MTLSELKCDLIFRNFGDSKVTYGVSLETKWNTQRQEEEFWKFWNYLIFLCLDLWAYYFQILINQVR